MIHFNYQEKVFLLSACAVLFIGGGLQASLKKYPALVDIIHVIENPRIYPKVDLNRAGKQELVRIPYIGEYTAGQIIRYRNRNGPFQTIDELMKVKGIRKKNFERFRAYLKVSP